MNTKPTNETHPLITPEHLRRRAVVYCRQAGERPAHLADIARSCGWRSSQIQIIVEHLGRAGSSAETRPGWERLQELIDTDQVGVVFVTTVSRLSRQVLEIELFRLRAAVHKTLLYTDGRFMDPADERDRILSEFIRMRDRWFAEQRAKAGK
jgi:DNA invertase Pin-like site-specific DNA recombinase